MWQWEKSREEWVTQSVSLWDYQFDLLHTQARTHTHAHTHTQSQICGVTVSRISEGMHEPAGVSVVFKPSIAAWRLLWSNRNRAENRLSPPPFYPVTDWKALTNGATLSRLCLTMHMCDLNQEILQKRQVTRWKFCNITRNSSIWVTLG